MSGPLKVRNLTAQPLTIKVIERYDAGNAQDLPPGERTAGGFFTRWTRGGGTHPTQGELGDKARNYQRDEVEIRLAPFTTHLVDCETTERKAGQLLRLTLHGDGSGKWRTDIPTPSTTSQRLTSLISDPPHDYIAIYLPSSTLAILESSNPQCWMRDFQEDTPLSALSIPGTHNSHTCYKALPSVRCQAVSIQEQLENGVRFLDIRVQPASPHDATKDTLNLVHGIFSIALTGVKRFRAVLDEVQDFLEQNPSETIILSMKREGTGSATDEQLSLILRDHYTTDSSKWYTEPRIPHLGEVRGKIVLLRRFALADRLKQEWHGRGWSLDAEDWDYNTPDCTHGDVRVQDYFEVLETESIQKKIEFCCDHFERAGQVICPIPGATTDNEHPVPAGPLFINFITGSNFWRSGCWPDRIAAKVNPAICSFLCEKHAVGDKGVDGPGEEFEGDGALGIVVCDWVGKDGDWDLVKTVVAMNGRLLLRQRERR